MLLQWNHPHNLVEACCLKSSTALANFDPGGALFHTLPTVFTKFLHQSPLDSHRLTNHHNYARSFNTPRNRINLADDAQKLTHHNHNWQTKSLGIRLEILTRFRTHYQDNGDIVLPSHTFTTFFLTSQDIPTSITKKFVLNQPRCQDVKGGQLPLTQTRTRSEINWDNQLGIDFYIWNTLGRQTSKERR